MSHAHRDNAHRDNSAANELCRKFAVWELSSTFGACWRLD